MVLREMEDTESKEEKVDAGRWYCCGVVELYNVFSSTPDQIREMCSAARHQIRAGTVIATTGASQTVTEKNLEEAGFKLMLDTNNPRMGNAKLKIWTCDVRDYPKV